MNRRPHANRGQVRSSRRFERNSLGQPAFSFQSLEDRQLLASDISLSDFSANGDQFLVSYNVAAQTVSAFNLSIYRSSDGDSLRTLLANRAITLESDLDPGAHTIEIDPDFIDPKGDYRLIAVADSLNQVAESSEDNNELVFTGRVFRTLDGVVHVHGSDSEETITIKDGVAAGSSGGGSLNVKIDDWMIDYDASTVQEIHVRLHGGDDVLNVQSRVSQEIHAYGGSGDDRILSGAGSDWLVGGAGDDFIAGRAGRDMIDGDRDPNHAGNDTLLGGADADTLVGFAGDDKLVGGSGKDILDGGEGRDIVDGGNDDDIVRGGKGADRIVNPPGRNEPRDTRSEDTLLVTTPEELIFGDLSAEDQGSMIGAEDSAESFGFSGYAGPFWIESTFGNPTYHAEGLGASYRFWPFVVHRAPEDASGLTATIPLSYSGTAGSNEFNYRQATVAMGTEESVGIEVKDDDLLESTETFIATIYDGASLEGVYFTVAYPAGGQGATNDTEGNPAQETAYIVDGDLTTYDSRGALDEPTEESGAFFQVGELYPLDITMYDDPNTDPDDQYILTYPSGIAVYENWDRTGAVPSGSAISISPFGRSLVIEAVAPVSNAIVSLDWTAGWNGGMVDRVLLSSVEIAQVTSVVPASLIPFGDNDPGTVFIPHTDSTGDLVAVHIMPPEGLQSYIINQDFWGSVDSATRDVKLEFVRPGEYVVEIVRQNQSGAQSTNWFEVGYKSSTTDKDVPIPAGAELGRYEIAKPTADLVLISTGAEPGKVANKNARERFGYDFEAIASVADAIAQINAYAAAHPGPKFSVLIIDHGVPAEMGVGSGTATIVGAYIDDSDTTKADTDALVAACKDRVSVLTLAGCTVGGRVNPRDPTSLDLGSPFLQRLANDGNMTVRAPEWKIGWREDGTCSFVKGFGWNVRHDQDN